MHAFKCKLPCINLQCHEVVSRYLYTSRTLSTRFSSDLHLFHMLQVIVCWSSELHQQVKAPQCTRRAPAIRCPRRRHSLRSGRRTADALRQGHHGGSAPGTAQQAAGAAAVAVQAAPARRFAKQQVPDDILHDKELNQAISVLPANYNFEASPRPYSLVHMAPIERIGAREEAS